MATCIYAQHFYELCEPRQCVIGDPKDTAHVPYDFAFENTTHTVLRLSEPNLPIPGKIPVNIFNASNGTSVPFKLKSTDTIGKLKQMFLKMRPEFGGHVDLAYNGKPVMEHQTLAELQVKAGASLITFHKCHGG